MKDLWWIAFPFREKSFRKLLQKCYELEKMPDDAVGWCSVFFKKDIPDIEIYIDTLAKYVAQSLREMGIPKDLFEEQFMISMKTCLKFTVLHELIHQYGKVQDEKKVDAAVDVLVRDAWMTWHFIPCPKLGHNVTWIECLNCDDLAKDPACPLQKIRIDAFQYKYEPNKYHVSELCFPRHAYYNRTCQHAMGWDQYYDMLYGKALGWYIESKFAEHQREVEVEKRFYDPKFGDFNVVGHADLVDDEKHNLYELKFYYSLKYLLDRGTPNPEHEYQARAYWTLGIESKPYMFKRIQKIKMIYYSKMKSRKLPRRKEFEVVMNPVNVEEPARILHEALKTGVPPKQKCPAWRCRYCDYKVECQKDG